MAENSKIAWTDNTFNPWIGCSRVSPGCENCYAENLMDRRYQRVKWGAGNPRSRTKTWNDPLRWNREAARNGRRTKVFCASLADYLDDEVPTQWREDLFDLIDQCRNLDWLLLTKRPQNAAVFLPFRWLDAPPSHVWYGVTAENQAYWNLRVPILQALPAAVRWVSYEPALGPLDIVADGHHVDWIIIGGESSQGKPARPFQLEWARSVIEQCRERAVAPFVKQVGTNACLDGCPLRLRDKAGANPLEWPEEFRIREFPACPATV
jgi:protein gp37